MISLKDYELFKEENQSTLKNLSVDGGACMVSSELKAIDFDKVKSKYCESLKLSEAPNSNDALFSINQNKLVFVEFKNGYIDKKTIYNIRKKIYDSLLIFNDIISNSIAYTRKSMIYILVYNKSKNNQNHFLEKKINEDSKSIIQNSCSYDNLAKTIGSYANEEYILFGLKMFENYCFKEVHSFTVSEFEKYIAENND